MKELSAKEIMDMGYRRISNSAQMVARVDRSDWKEFMAKSHAPWSITAGLRWIESLGAQASDHYRRCFSHDKLTINDSKVFKEIKGSGADPVGFIPAVFKKRIKKSIEKSIEKIYDFYIKE